MKLEFTRHAKRRIKFRKISIKEIKDVIVNPDSVEPDPEVKGRLRAYKLVGSKNLCVVHVYEKNKTIILSVWDKWN